MEQTKSCFKCKKNKPIEDYNKVYRSGVLAVFNTCAACRTAFVQQKIETDKQKKAAIDLKL